MLSKQLQATIQAKMSTTLRRSTRLAAKQQPNAQPKPKAVTYICPGTGVYNVKMDSTHQPGSVVIVPKVGNKENILCRRSHRLQRKHYDNLSKLYKQIPDDPRLRSYTTTLDFGMAKIHFQMLFDRVQFEKILTEKVKHVMEVALFMEMDERVHKILALSPRFRRVSLEKFRDLEKQMPYNPILKGCTAKVQALVERLSTRPDFIPDPFEFN